MPFGGQHPVDVLGGGLVADQHHLLAPLRRGLGVVGGQVDPPHRRSGRGAQPGGQHRMADAVELGMEDLVEMVTGDPLQRLLLAQMDDPLPHHVHGHLEGGPPGALAHPGLEHPQLALLDGELGIAHVPVVGLEPGEDGQELAVDLREPVPQGGERLGVPDAGHHVLALGVDQEVAVLAGGPGGRVAGEAHPGARGVVTVAEHHGLHVDRRAQVVGDALAHPVGDGPRAVPRGEDGLDGPPQLVVGVLRERGAGVALHDLLVGVDQVAEQLDGHPGVRGGAGQLLGRVEQGVELVAGDAQHDAAVHGHEPPVGVVGEALVVGLLGQALDRLVVEPQVEDGVHHPGHGELGPRPHRHQQRVARVADALAHLLLQPQPGPWPPRRSARRATRPPCSRGRRWCRW